MNLVFPSLLRCITAFVCLAVALTAQSRVAVGAGPADGAMSEGASQLMDITQLQPVGQDTYLSALAPGVLVDHELPAGPGGTGTDYPEAIQYQLGSRYQTTGAPFPMVIAYHGFGSGAASVAAQSTLDELCNTRGFVFLSVTGIDSQVFGTPPAQRNVEAAMQWMLDHHNVDPDRLFMVGFSMGAGITENFAARHRDPAGLMLAAIGLVSATSDWTATYELGTAGTQQVLEAQLNFGTSPALDPFGYQSASGLVFDGTGGPLSLGEVIPELSMVSNLGSTPVFLTWDVNDLVFQSKTENPKRALYLPQVSNEVVVKTKFNTTDPVTGAPATHSWAVLNENQLFNFFKGKRVVREPTNVTALLAEDGTVGRLTVVRSDQGAFGSVDAEVADGLVLHASGNVAQLGFDAHGAGSPSRLQLAVPDGESLRLTLSGYEARPSYVLDDVTADLVPDVASDPRNDALALDLLGPTNLVASVVSDPSWSATLVTSPNPVVVGEPVVLSIDGPSQAEQALLIFGFSDTLSVFPGGQLIGVSPLPPALIIPLALDAAGDGEFPRALTGLGPVAVVHLQAVLLDGRGESIAATNSWLLELE